MKTILKSILTLGLAAGLGFAANAQKTAIAPASASVLADLTISLDGTLNEIAFGNLSASTPDQIILDANGISNANTGSITKVAKFDLEGANVPVTVSYDATVTLTESIVGTATMIMTPQVVGAAVDTEQATAGTVTSGNTVTLASGVYFLWVGGTIPALSSQATGVYEGTFNISVEYN
ncbi:DUF4402 domain-containing protein [Algoriphagus sp.]|uniref:DUF4402 domain-containing protein n=1 Tax=Algoriphagus sp. TaxID=1872435 RepID=UPI00391ADC97